MRYQGNRFSQSLSLSAEQLCYEIYRKMSYIKNTHILAHVTSLAALIWSQRCSEAGGQRSALVSLHNTYRDTLLGSSDEREESNKGWRGD